MKRCFLLVAFLCFSMMAFSQTNLLRGEGFDPKQAAKDYFLCRCIQAGFGKQNLHLREFSTALYRDFTSLFYEELIMFNQLADKIGTEAPSYRDSVNVADLHESVVGLSGVLVTCIEYYKGPELDSMIRTFKFSKDASKNED